MKTYTSSAGLARPRVVPSPLQITVPIQTTFLDQVQQKLVDETLLRQNAAESQLNNARQKRSEKNYSGAITDYDAALGILNGNTYFTLFRQYYDFSNEQIARVYFERAECLVLNKEYVKAYTCAQELLQFSTDDFDIELKLTEVKQLIITTLKADMDEIIIIAFIRKDLKLAKNKIKIIKEIAKSLGFEESISETSFLENRIIWEEQKTKFLADYNIVLNVNINELDTIALKYLREQITELCLRVQRVFNGPIPHHESTCLDALKLKTQDIAERYKYLVVRQEWQQLSAKTYVRVRSIENMNDMYAPTTLPKVVLDLETCAKRIKDHLDFLDDDERKQLINEQLKITTMLTTAKQQIHLLEVDEKRGKEEYITRASESAITQYLLQARNCLQDFDLEGALAHLAYARDVAKDKIKSTNILHDETRCYAQQDFFDPAIKELSEFIDQRNARIMKHTAKWAIKIIQDALNKCILQCPKTLVERHQDLFVVGLIECIKEHWQKFDQKPEAEIFAFFDTVSAFIATHLSETDFYYRWRLNNWTSAALCLHKDGLGSKDILAQTKEKIVAYVPPTDAITINLEIFEILDTIKNAERIRFKETRASRSNLVVIKEADELAPSPLEPPTAVEMPRP